MARFRLAHALGKTVDEVEGMTMWEWAHWNAYFALSSGSGR
jgi:uncharacterized membrane protein (DUF2068 family)